MKDFEFQTEASVFILPDRKSPEGIQTVRIPRNPVKAIRLHCLDCHGGYKTEVEKCDVKCPLNPFRFGNNPFYKKTELTEEQKAAQKARGVKLAKARSGAADRQTIGISNNGQISLPLTTG